MPIWPAEPGLVEMMMCHSCRRQLFVCEKPHFRTVLLFSGFPNDATRSCSPYNIRHFRRKKSVLSLFFPRIIGFQHVFLLRGVGESCCATVLVTFWGNVFCVTVCHFARRCQQGSGRLNDKAPFKKRVIKILSDVSVLARFLFTCWLVECKMRFILLLFLLYSYAVEGSISWISTKLL